MHFKYVYEHYGEISRHLDGRILRQRLMSGMVLRDNCLLVVSEVLNTFKEIETKVS